MQTAPTGSRSFGAHFLESVVLTWAGHAARIVIGLVALRLVTGAIPEADLGAYWVLTSVSALLANFADLGLGLGVVRHLPIAADAAAGRRLMHTVLWLRVGVLVLLCALIAALKPWVLRLFDAEIIATKYSYLYAFVVVTSLGELYNNFLQGLNRFRAMAVYALVSSAGRLVLLLLFVRRMGLGVEGLFLSEVLSLAMAALLSAWSSGHGPRTAFDRDHAREQLRFGFPLYLNTLLSYTANRVNTVLIGSLRDTVAVSWFSVAARVPDQLSFALRAYNLVYLPNLTRLAAGTDATAAPRLLGASMRLMGCGFALLALVLSFLRRPLLDFLAPASYQVAAPAVPLLLGGLAFAALGSILGSTLVALGDSRTPVRINFWTSLIAFGLNATCIARWGFMGAAWANLLWNAIAYGITDAVVSRRIRPAGRGYLAIVAWVAACVVAGVDANVAVRCLMTVVAAGGCLVVSPALRRDLARVWSTTRGRGAGQA
jgi:O-antigen/teichoic acid export membrane protein